MKKTVVAITGLSLLILLGIVLFTHNTQITGYAIIPQNDLTQFCNTGYFYNYESSGNDYSPDYNNTTYYNNYSNSSNYYGTVNYSNGTNYYYNSSSPYYQSNMQEGYTSQPSNYGDTNTNYPTPMSGGITKPRLASYDLNGDFTNDYFYITCDLRKNQVNDMSVINYPVNSFFSTITTLDENNIENAARWFLDRQINLLKIDTNNLVLKHKGLSSLTENKKATGIVQYTQVYQGMPVWGAGVTVFFVENKYAQVVNGYSPINYLSNSGIEKTQNELKTYTQIRAQERGYSLSGYEPRINYLVYPIKSETTIDYIKVAKLDYSLVYNTNSEIGYTSPTFIMDIQTGQILEEIENLYYTDVSGIVTGKVYRHNLEDTSEEHLPLQGETVIVGESSSTTIPSGVYQITGINLPSTIYTSLNGPKINLYNCNFQTSTQCPNNPLLYEYTDSMNVPNKNIEWYNIPTSSQYVANMFYHANNIYNYFYSSSEEPFNIYPNLQPYSVYIDVIAPTGRCNAFSATEVPGSIDGIYFFELDPELRVCEEEFYQADIVYHEYTHSILNTLYINPRLPSKMHEGLADYYGAVAGCLGNNYEGDCDIEIGTGMRSLDNNVQFPQDTDTIDPHINGMALSGTFYELREWWRDSGNSPFEFDTLVFNTIKRNTARGEYSFENLMEDLLYEDNMIYDDNNINNGGGHLEEFCNIMYETHGMHPANCQICPNMLNDPDNDAIL